MNVLETPTNSIRTSLREATILGDVGPNHVAVSPSLASLSVDCPHTSLENLCLNFQISLNEEHTFLSVSYGNKQDVDLGERAHHYSLLTLARRRLDDAKNGLDPSSQGWLELAQLSKSLGIEPEHLNIQIFRARTQLLNALPQLAHLPSIIERRRGEVRFGAHQFCIVRGSRLEGEYSPHNDLAFA